MPPESSKFDLMRLQHLDQNISETLELLAAYQSDLPLIEDPAHRERYRRRILGLQGTVAQYRQEYEALEAKIAARPQQVVDVGNQLHRLEEKLDTVLDHVDGLPNIILAGLEASEQSIIAGVLARLDQDQLETTQAILSSWKANQISQTIPIIPFLLSYEIL